MKISIITTTFNSENTVKDTLDSIFSQTYKDIESIIIDGGSNDTTLQLLNDFPKIDHIISEKDDGVYFAMNKGIEIANGEIIGILNSDDVYLDNQVIEKVVAMFMGTDVDAVYGDLHYVDYNNLNKVTRVWKSRKYDRAKFLNGWMPPHPTFFVRKSVYEKYGKFNTKLKSAADYEIMLRFLYKHQIKVAYIPEVLVKMRTGGISNSSLMNRLRANKEDRMAWGINDLKPKFYIRWLKPLRKIFQFRIF